QNAAEMRAASVMIMLENWPIMFSMGVAICLAGRDGVAAIAAVVGFISLNKTMGEFFGVTSDTVADAAKGSASVLGIPKLQTGVFGGIIIGALASWCYNK
ncbi:PTS glucose transporter subunit IICBA, partial [Staphylococcus pseudintermedius]|uniref:PTS transporter subunit EIIC n=1 Tax=Staphylococcus pseudintermedius TaxID=283734 RepID=UPI000E37B14D